MQLKMFCLCLDDFLLDKVKKLNYIPVGLGEKYFSDQWLRDNTGENISNKNSFYGEYSFHYWLWKNYLKKNKNQNEWIGFCAYRRFWSNNKTNQDQSHFKDKVLNTAHDDWKNYDVILGNHQDVSDFKWMKLLKYGKKALLRNPKAIFKKNRNIKFQFDMFHGTDKIDKAIELLDDKNRDAFRNYIYKNSSYNQGNMFITNSYEIMNEYYKTIFNWLEKCENVFGFDLHGYGNQRIYGFLAERFLPYWFNQNCKVLEWPIIFHDLKNEIT